LVAAKWKRFETLRYCNLCALGTSTRSPRAFSKQNAKGAGPGPAPMSLHMSLHMSAIVHMPALISICTIAAFAASFCCWL
jgi:hypothetical protein